MNYKVGNTIWVYNKLGFVHVNSGQVLPEWILKEMGATPIDDKPEKIGKLGEIRSFDAWTIRDKINEIIKWINNHEREI